MNIKYGHTNIITKDWKRLCDFYQVVFNCIPVPPPRDHKGLWLDLGTGINHAHIQGIHLLLPGFGSDGPTLEIYQYGEIIDADKSKPNQKGISHIAFQTDEIHKLLDLALEKGASKIGELSEKHIDGVGLLTFIYISDPDGNIIELQHWS